MITERFLRHRAATLDNDEQALLAASVTDTCTLTTRRIVVAAGEQQSQSLLLVEGFLCRYIDDRRGIRQLVALHVPGDFVDLHSFPLGGLDHHVSTLTAAKVAAVPHAALAKICEDRPALAKKLWYATLLDAAIHRAWLFRLGRLDAFGRIAHFLCETNARLQAVGLSDGQRFAFGLTQSDLAEICGITSVHVNRVLRGMREEQIMTFRSGQVEIHDSERLAHRGEFDPSYLYLDEGVLAAIPAFNRSDRCLRLDQDHLLVEASA